MRCIVQISTGNRDICSCSSQQIIDRFETVTALVAVSKVIIGWHPDKALYRAVGEWLHKKQIEMLLWLPVFAESDEFEPMIPAKDVFGNIIPPPKVQEGEMFSFCCPSSKENLDAVCRIYDEHFAECGFDGVFLDRIRTHSFVGGVEGVLSCGCDRCREQGIPADEAANAYRACGDRFFDQTENGFSHPVARRFFEAKGRLIAQSVRYLSDHFREKGLQVGLDLYAPFMSGFVGQDYARLAQCADFIKPMLYRCTQAPAGMGYEHRLQKHFAPDAKGYPELLMDTAFLREQLARCVGLPCEVYAGIEVNHLGDIAPTDVSYVTESAQTIRQSGADGAVLSWNVMCAPDAHLRAFASVME